MKISLRLPQSVKKCLLLPTAGLLALALTACSQSQEPETEKGTTVTVVEPTKPAKPNMRSGRKRVKKTPAPQPAAEELAVPSVAEEPLPDESSAPAISPVELPSPFVPSAPGKRIAQVSVPEPWVAVTFDDGPSAALTPQVLDIFARHGAHATFFVQGRNANRNRSILARAVAEGHEIGSHTWSHINMRASGMGTIIQELDRTAAVIEEATGSRPKVMRPPYGAVNKSLVEAVYSRYGTPSILWDVDTNDWRKPGVQTVIDRAVNKAKPGSIILLHDIHPSTVKAVEGIVTGLQARGFKLVTVSELIALGRQAAGVAEPAAEAAPAEQGAAAASVETVAAEQPLPQLPEGEVGMGLPAVTQPASELSAPSAASPSAEIPAEDDYNFYEES